MIDHGLRTIIVIAGGVEIDERASAWARPAAPGTVDPSGGNIPAYFMPQGVSADLIATKYGFSRDDVDAYAVESQKRARRKRLGQGQFQAKSVIPVKDHQRPDASSTATSTCGPGTDMQSLGSAAARPSS